MPARSELSMTQSPDAAEETKPNGRVRYLITDNRHLSTTCKCEFFFGRFSNSKNSMKKKTVQNI